MDCVYLQLNHDTDRQTTSETGSEAHEERIKRKIHRAILTDLIFFTNFQSLFLKCLFTIAMKKNKFNGIILLLCTSQEPPLSCKI